MNKITISFAEESIVRTGWYDANRCFKNNAQCVIIEYYCICHCLAGYILVDKKCLKSKIAFLLINNYHVAHSTEWFTVS